MTDEFRAKAERRALRARRLLDLSCRARLEPRRLAQAMDIGVFDLSALADVPDAHRQRLLHDDVKALSAAAVIDPPTRGAVIVVNDQHTLDRQAGSIAHELAHIMLEHPPGYVIPREPPAEATARTFLNLSQAYEDEADWLAGCLLAPACGIKATMQACGQSIQRAAAHYGVALETMQQRHAFSLT